MKLGSEILNYIKENKIISGRAALNKYKNFGHTKFKIVLSLICLNFIGLLKSEIHENNLFYKVATKSEIALAWVTYIISSSVILKLIFN